MKVIHKIIMASAMFGCAYAQNLVSVEAFDEQGNNPSQLTLRLKLTNNTSNTLNDVHAKYFLGFDRNKTLNVSPYYMAGATTSIDTVGDFLVVNINVASLAPGVFPNSSGISLGMNYTDWSAFNKRDNFSYPNSNHFVIMNNIPVYVNGAIVAGLTPINDPVNEEPPKVRFVGIQPENTATRSAWVELQNYDTADVNLSNLYLKWSASDSVGIGNVTLSAGQKVRICQSSSLECPTADVTTVKGTLSLGQSGNLGVSKNGMVFQQIVWNDSNKTLSGSHQADFSISRIPYDLGSITSNSIKIENGKGLFFTLINGIWVCHRANDINNEEGLPSPVAFIENQVVYDTSSLYRFAWHPVRNAGRYVLTVKTPSDSIVYQDTTSRTYVDLNLTGSDYLWSVQHDKGRVVDAGSFWNRITKSAAAIDNTHLLGIPAFAGRKDSKMLVLTWGEKVDDPNIPWDRPNDTGRRTEEDDSRCWAIAIHMLNAFYGGSLKQDEIVYHGKTQPFNIKMHTPDGVYTVIREKRENEIDVYLGRNILGEIEINTISSAGKAKNIIGTFGIDIGGAPTETKATLAWALSITDDEVEDQMANPSIPNAVVPLTEDIVKSYIDMGRPLLVSIGEHAMVIDGYDYHDAGNRKVHFLNLKNGGETAWMPLNSFTYVYYLIPPPRTEAVGRRGDSRIDRDDDGDGICNFDEVERFGTDPNHPDSDRDGVDDKTEIYRYTKKEPFVIRKNIDGEEMELHVGEVKSGSGSPDGNPYHLVFFNVFFRLEQYADEDGDGKRNELDNNSDGELTITWDLPNDITIYSLEAIRVNDRTICRDGEGYCKIASESGRIDFAVNVGVESIVGDVYSCGGVWLRSRSQVHGDIYIYSKPFNESSVYAQEGAVYNSSMPPVGNFNEWPYKNVWDNKPHPIDGIESAPPLIVAAGQEKTLGNGDMYSKVKVESGATLKIMPGEIKVGDIQFESGSTITFTNPGQRTVIQAEGNFIWRTTISNEDKELVARGFKLIQNSDKEVNIEGDWAGTIHAARSSLVMGQTKKIMYGRFLAKLVTMHQESRIYRVDFAPINPSANLAGVYQVDFDLNAQSTNFALR